MGRVRHNLRRLRDFLGLEQRELAVLVKRTRHTIEAIEQNRLRLSPQLAFQISRACGIDAGWLLSGDSDLPMVNRRANVYGRRDFEQAQDEDLKPLQVYELSPEMEVAVAYDLLYRALRAARKKNKVSEFIKWLKDRVREAVHQFPELKEEVYGGLRSGKAAGKDFLFPRDAEPLSADGAGLQKQSPSSPPGRKRLKSD